MVLRKNKLNHEIFKKKKREKRIILHARYVDTIWNYIFEHCFGQKYYFVNEFIFVQYRLTIAYNFNTWKRRRSFSRVCNMENRIEVDRVSIPNFLKISPVCRESTFSSKSAFFILRVQCPFFTFVIFRAFPSQLAARTIRRGCRRFFAGTVPPHCC